MMHFGVITESTGDAHVTEGQVIRLDVLVLWSDILDMLPQGLARPAVGIYVAE
jgi:hypothetical protein